MAVEFKDYYKILGVPKNATEKEIKAAYRRLARKHHPDLNKGDARAEARFKEVNEANEVLSDPEKRRRYDSLGPDWAARPGGGWSGGGTRVDVGDIGGFSEFFRTIFGGGFGGGAAVETGPFGGGFEEVFSRGARGRGQDLETEVELTLEEVLRGTARTVQVGEGKGASKVEVRIPVGVRDGSRVRVAGVGGGRPGVARGDLYLKVRVLPHASFERQGDDLRTTLTVPLTTAVLGGEAQAPTLDGPVGIRIPAGSPVGRTFRLRGHGLPRLEAKGERGDCLAVLSVSLPGAPSGREREIFEELRKLGR